MKTFFNKPDGFSFKDFLACVMIAPFVLAAGLFLYKHVSGDLDLIKTLVPVIITVLGGYFGQEVATAYFTRGNTANPYNGLIYPQPTTTPTTITPESLEQDQSGPL